MNQKKIKIGLALGSGGPRGFAHIGVLRAFEQAGIDIDLISGSSIGSVVASYYALHKSVEGLEEKMLKVVKMNLFKLFDIHFTKGLINQKKIVEALFGIIGLEKFTHTKIPLFISSTNLDNGNNKIFKNSLIIDAVQASCSMPFIFKPINHQDTQFADGALSDPVPVDILRKAGADIVIAVNLYHESEFKAQSFNAASNLFRSGRIMMYHLAQEKCKEADYVININLSKFVISAGLKYLFSSADSAESVNIGYKQTKKAMRKIYKIINEKNDKEK